MLHLNRTVKSNARAQKSDVLALKTRLRAAGYGADLDPDSPYPDRRLFTAIRDFQSDQGLKIDGTVTPKGETATALSERTGTHYIWRTSGDSKVRSEHAERNGKIFSWDTPPKGGHPGEAPNCRCVAEPVIDKSKVEQCRLMNLEIRNLSFRIRSLLEGTENLNKEQKDAWARVERLYEKLWKEIGEAGVELGLSMFPVGKIPYISLLITGVVNSIDIYNAYKEYKSSVLIYNDAVFSLQHNVQKILDLREEINTISNQKWEMNCVD